MCDTILLSRFYAVALSLGHSAYVEHDVLSFRFYAVTHACGEWTCDQNIAPRWSLLTCSGRQRMRDRVSRFMVSQAEGHFDEQQRQTLSCCNMCWFLKNETNYQDKLNNYSCGKIFCRVTSVVFLKIRQITMGGKLNCFSCEKYLPA